jgi:cytochrome c oxidase subunit II
MITRCRALATGWVPLALAACDGGPQRATDPAGPGSQALWDLIVVFVAVTTLPAAVFIAALLVASLRRRKARHDLPPKPRREAIVILGAGGGFAALVVTALMLVSFDASRAIMAPPSDPTLTVEVTGHMFWWEVHYPEHGVRTANELHIPKGEPVRVRLDSLDVIHSFWVPQLHGKLDMIPGRTHEMWLQADRTGEFRGQCAEFCGVQHALMAFLVVSEEPGDFAAWLDAQGEMQGRREPGTLAARGEQVFVEQRCHVCHAVRGAFEVRDVGTPGPDLTHFASRRTLGAATMRLTRDNLRDWIRDPHRRKPGVRMPPTRLSEADMNALLAYLEGLR